MLVRSCRKDSAYGEPGSCVTKGRLAMSEASPMAPRIGALAISSAGCCAPTLRSTLSRATATTHPHTSPANSPSARLSFCRGAAGASGVVAH